MASLPSSRRGISRLEATFRPPDLDRRASTAALPDASTEALFAVLTSTEAEPTLDQLAELVCTVLGVPVAVLSTVQDNREFYRSWCGLPAPLAQRRTIPLAESLSRSVLVDHVRVVLSDGAGQGNALAQTLDWHAYAGVPLRPGAPLGALWVVDPLPRAWSDEDLSRLEAFAAHAVRLIDAIALRRRADAALRDREARYDALAGSTQHGVWCVAFEASIPTALTAADLVDRMFERGRLVECNDAFARALGAELGEDMLGVPFGELLDRSDETVRAALLEFVENGFRLDRLTSPARAGTGERRTFGTLAGVVEGGRLTRLWGVLAHGSARVEAGASSSTRSFEALGRLANGVAHEFNNLLTTIRGRTELALRERGSNDDLLEIRRATDRASSLSRQLLSFGRRLPSRPAILRPDRLVADFETVLQHVAGDDADLLTRCAADTGYVRADLSEIERALIHIVTFARDAAPEAGRFVVSTRNIVRRVTPAESPVPHVALCVSHATLELGQEMLSRIAEAEFGALTLGGAESLVAAFALVRQAGGELSVESGPGSGTTFEIALPRLAETDTTKAEPAVEPAGSSGGETVLIVEDEEGVRAVARRTLLLQGYTVMEAENGVVALEVAGAYPGHIHLLLTDVVMPGLNGRELADRLCSLRPDTRVVFMSGYAGNVMPAGPSDAPLLEKPFTPAVLSRAIRAALDRAD